VRVPFVVVTGFLGSGKTTLINQLLARRATRPPGEGKLAVIVNELGEVGIDGALLGGAPTQVELPGGCVCCVLGDELDKTVLEVVRTNPGLAAIVLETTGVAEPLPIAWALSREPVASEVRLTAVVTLVDAANFVASRGVSVAVDAQVAYADVVLLTKEQLADDLPAVEAAVHALAPRAEIRRGQHAPWLDALLDDPPVDEHHPTQPASHVHTDACRHTDSAHGIDSCWVAVAELVDLEELEDQLAALPGNYVRIKGVVRTKNGWAVIHRVGLRVSSEPLTTVPRFMIGRLVALGTQLDVDALAVCAARASDLLREAYTQ
jgi:G3E family GTPase